MGTRLPMRDRALVLYDLLDRIAQLKAGQADAEEIELLAAEFRRLRTEL